MWEETVVLRGNLRMQSVKTAHEIGAWNNRQPKLLYQDNFFQQAESLKGPHSPKVTNVYCGKLFEGTPRKIIMEARELLHTL